MEGNWDSANTTQLTEGSYKEVEVITAECGHKEQVRAACGLAAAFTLEKCGGNLVVMFVMRERTNDRERDFSVRQIPCRQ